MANAEHLLELKKGVESWNQWIAGKRRASNQGGTRHPGAKIGTSSFWADLRDANLNGEDLYQGKAGAGWTGIDAIGIDLRGADLRNINLAWANLTGATLERANLAGASLANSRLDGSNLSRCVLTGANLAGATLRSANLQESDVTGVNLYETVFADTDLTDANGLEQCRYSGPCTVDHRTLFDYAELPTAFLRGCGLSDLMIEYIPSLRTSAIEFYSCFISFSSKDQDFATRLHADLQAQNVRCWFAPEHLRIGDKTWDSIDRAIRSRDKVVLICSENSIRSEWVEDEVNKAFAEERRRGCTVLFPVRIDNSVMETEEPWASKLRDSRNIGDFRHWNDQASYETALQRALRDLRSGPQAVA